MDKYTNIGDITVIEENKVRFYCRGCEEWHENYPIDDITIFINRILVCKKWLETSGAERFELFSIIR